MRTLVLDNHIESLPMKRERSYVDRYEGFLTSNYKEIAKSSFFHSRPDSIFGKKQRAKSNLYQYTSSIDVGLKLSVFAIVLAVIL